MVDQILYSTKTINTQHISTIGTSLNRCWAHLSPRVRVELTSSPVYGGIITKGKKGRRVTLMSDILRNFWEVTVGSMGFKLGKKLSTE